MHEKSRKFIPGGVNSPVRAFRSVGTSPIYIRSGKGSRIYDIDGNEYIDFVSSWGPLILGHAHPEVVDAVKKAAEHGTSFGAPTELELELAMKIVSMVPGIEKVRLVNSGTEATMSAVRLARGATGRDKIIKFEGCYHGHADSFLIKAGSGAATFGIPSSPGVPASLASDTLNAAYNDLDSVRQLFENNPRTIACIIVEPVAGNMGVVPPEKGFLEGLRKLADEFSALLIFDEVITGFRLALGGAQQDFNVIPDLTTLGKIIGGGLPVGAYGGRADLMDRMAPEGPIYQAGTLSGNPLAVSAGLATLGILERENPYSKLESLSEKLFTGMEKEAKELGFDIQVKWISSLGCGFFTSTPIRNWSDVSTCDTKLFAEFHQRMLKRGIYLAPSQFEASFISAAHTEDDINRALDAFQDSLRDIRSSKA